MHPYIEIFGNKLQSYYVCAAMAGITGAVLSAAYLRRKNQGVWAFILPLVLLISAVIGARLLNFVTNPRAFSKDFSVWTFSYRKLSLMGGLMAGVAVIIIYCLLRKESFAIIADAFTVPASAGIMILKVGCFLNGCCFGKPTDGPFGMVFPANESRYDFINSLKIVSAKSPVVHPTQLYEIFGALMAMLFAIIIPKAFKLKKGSRASIFAAVFSAARWIVLPLRELPYDQKMITVFYPTLYAALIVISSVYLIIINTKKEAVAGKVP